MIRFDSPPVHLLDLEKKTGQNGKTAYFSYLPPGAEGTMRSPRAGITLLRWSDRATAPWGKPSQFEYHTLHEEIFVLTGALNFNNLYSVNAPGYQNHPPFWVHPTNFWAVGDLTMLMRGDTDPIVQFQDIPQSWNGVEGFAAAKPTRCTGVSKLQMDDIPWAAIMGRGGDATGLMAKRLWDDRDDGWTTWMMKVKPGWRSSGPAVSVSGGGDEIYVVEGDLSVGWAANAALRPSGYLCAAHAFTDGAGAMSSIGGATFVRWTRGAEHAWKVEPALSS
jgi:hypothetical protein